jgi:hypothetical protein
MRLAGWRRLQLGWETKLPSLTRPSKAAPKQQTDHPAPSPQNQAAIIFISACNRDANIQTWLRINYNMPGRALVVPPSNTCRVILVMPPTGEHYGPGVNEGLNQQNFNKQIDEFTAMRKSSLTEF